MKKKPKESFSNKMRVSFDLDEVLFVSPKTHKTEPELSFPMKIFFKERLRLGTPELIRELQNMDIEVWVYTSSFRTEQYIRRLFRLYHTTFDGIINAQRHLKEVQADHKEILPQKMPGKYRISLHIDDESVIETHGRTYGFQVYALEAQDDNWKEKIIDRVKIIKAQAEREHSPEQRDHSSCKGNRSEIQ